MTDTYFSNKKCTGKKKPTFANPKRTDWEFYKDNLKVNFEVTPCYKCSVENTELVIDWLQQSTRSSYHHNCPVRAAHSPRRILRGING
jgi:hypothetical protein